MIFSWLFGILIVKRLADLLLALIILVNDVGSDHIQKYVIC